MSKPLFVGSSRVNKSSKRIAPKPAPRSAIRSINKSTPELEPDTASRSDNQITPQPAPPLSEKSAANSALQPTASSASESLPKPELAPGPLLKSLEQNTDNATDDSIHKIAVVASTTKTVVDDSTPETANTESTPKIAATEIASVVAAFESLPETAVGNSEPSSNRISHETLHVSPHSSSQAVTGRRKRTLSPEAEQGGHRTILELAENAHDEDQQGQAQDTVENEGDGVTDGMWVNATLAGMKQKETVMQNKNQVAQARQQRNALPVESIEDSANTSPAPVRAISARVVNKAKRMQRKRALEAAMSSREEGRSSNQEEREGEYSNADDLDGALQDSDDIQTSRRSERTERPRKIRKIRKRAQTPEESETVTIVPSVVNMFDLAARDRRTGLKSDRERRMQQIDWGLVKQRRKEEEIRRASERGRRRNMTPDPEDDEEEPQNEEDIDAALLRVSARNKASGKFQSLQVRVVNGDHVVVEQSQRVDRHAMANEDVENLEEVDEEELTSHFNSHTYIHLKRRDPAERIPSKDKWDTFATDKFYDCLSRFGTDFMIISKMFPGRTRRQIKAKFVREERANFARVQEALQGDLNDDKPSWDLEVFRESAGLDLSAFKDPRVVEAELLAIRLEKEKAIEAQKLLTAEEKRQRHLAGEISEEEEEEDDDDDDDVNNENRTVPSRNNGVKKVLDDDELEEVLELSDGDV